MGSDAEPLSAVRDALSRAATERHRARRAAQIADRHEKEAETGSAAMAEFHTGLAALHRRAADRHTVAARVHLAYAAQVRKSAKDSRGQDAPTLYMAGVADIVHARGASAIYLGTEFGRTLRIGSDATAKSVQDLEIIVGEGPSLDAIATRRTVTVGGAEMAAAWPLYGPAAAELGVTELVSVPVGGTKERALGALTVYQPSPALGRSETEWVRAAADSMTMFLLGGDEGGDTRALWRHMYADQLAVLHQAAGILAVRQGCSVQDALDLIGAQAFADGVPAEDVAATIMHDHLHKD